jgi:O-antigen/teichoic acid export membrane protein
VNADSEGHVGRLIGGTAFVALGLAGAGAGTLGMFALAARGLPADQYAAFAVWWTIGTLLGFTFGVFEAYLARLVVTDLAAGRDPSAVTGDLAGRALQTAVAMSAACALLAFPLAGTFFGDSVAAALLLPLFLSLTAAQAVQRGVATGHRRFGAVAGQLGTDGILRAAFLAVLMATGTATLVTAIAAACAASLLALLVGDRLCPPWRVRPSWSRHRVPAKPLLLLLVGAVGPVLANSGSAPWLAAVGEQSPTTIGAFVGALTLSRLPTQFVAAAFGPLLAELSHAVEAMDERRYRQLQRGADAACAAIAMVFVLGFALLGQQALAIYLGPEFELPVATLALLAAASGLMLSAVVRQAGMVAMDGLNTIAAAWTAGAGALLVTLLLPLEPLTRAAAAPLAAVLVALVVLSLVRPRFTHLSGTAADGRDDTPDPVRE